MSEKFLRGGDAHQEDPRQHHHLHLLRPLRGRSNQRPYHRRQLLHLRQHRLAVKRGNTSTTCTATTSAAPRSPSAAQPRPPAAPTAPRAARPATSRPTTPSPARSPTSAASSTTTPATRTPRWAPSSRRLPCRPGLLPTAQQRALKGRILQERYRSQSRCKRSCRGSGSQHACAARGGPSAALSVAGGQSMNAATLRRQPLRGPPRRLRAPIDLHNPCRFPAAMRRAMPTRPEWPENPYPNPATAPRRRPASDSTRLCFLRQFYRCG